MLRNWDYWIEIIEMLQQNWALIEETEDDKVVVYFNSDISTVFDELNFASKEEAKMGLRRNGFKRYEDDPSYKDFITPPKPPYTPHWNKSKKFYSSGKFWK